MKIKSALFSTLLIALVFTSCQKDKNDVENPPLNNEEELITTLKVNLSHAGDTSTFQFKDIDGEGGANGTIDTIKIQPGVSYACNLEFLDESNPSSVSNITKEIKAEGVDHLICFEVVGDAIIFRTDKDDNNIPLGLSSEWTVSVSGTGSVTIRLRHQPGIKDGSCDKGDTDIEVTFPIVIQ